MKSKLHIDETLSNIINRIGYLIWLSILWIVGCLPIITIGTSTTAMYYTTVKVLKKEYGYLSKEFFKSYKKKLVSGMIFTGIYFVVLSILYIDIRYVLGDATGRGGRNSLYLVIYFMLTLVLVSILMYLFPILSRFEMKLINILKFSFYIAFRHFIVTLYLMVLQVVGGIIMWLFPMPGVLLLPAGICFIESLLIEPIFKRYMAKPKNEHEKENMWYY